jgi:uncharacterized protein (TIGR00251 family)
VKPAKSNKAVSGGSTGPAAKPQPAGCPFAEVHPQGVLLRVRVQPRASRTSVEGPLGNELKIRVAAPPVDDAANEALRRFLADLLARSRADVQLLRGQKSRSKLVLVSGATLSAVTAALATS